MTEMLVVQHVVLAEGQRAGEEQRHVADDAQQLVSDGPLGHQVVGAFVHQHVEGVVDEGPEAVGQQQDDQPVGVAHQERDRPLQRH